MDSGPRARHAVSGEFLSEARETRSVILVRCGTRSDTWIGGPARTGAGCSSGGTGASDFAPVSRNGDSCLLYEVRFSR